MWDNIKGTVQNAIGGTVYSIWGRVGIKMNYNRFDKEIKLTVYDKPYACENKKEVVSENFKYNLETVTEMQAKHDVIAMIEKYLLENFA